jgi:hypothetical protein
LSDLIAVIRLLRAYLISGSVEALATMSQQLARPSRGEATTWRGLGGRGHRQRSAFEPGIVLADHAGRRLISHHTAMPTLDIFYYNGNRRPVVVPWSTEQMCLKKRE